MLAESLEEPAEGSAEPRELHFWFPYAKRDELRRVATICIGLYLGMASLFALAVGQAGWPGLVFSAVYGAACMVIVATWWRHWAEHPQQQVRIEGLTLEVFRHGAVGEFESTFNVLEMHDLQFNPNGIRYQVVWPLPRNHRPPWWMFPEPISFTYHGRAYSFGGAPMKPDEAAQVIKQLSAYDAALRRHYGMPPEPNMVTFDRERFSVAAIDGWDTDMPARVLA